MLKAASLLDPAAVGYLKMLALFSDALSSLLLAVEAGVLHHYYSDEPYRLK